MPTVVGFGNSSPISNILTVIQIDVLRGQFAFSVPKNGTLSNFQVSFDALAAVLLGIGSGSATFTFTAYTASCINGQVTNPPSYVPTALTASATLTVPPSILAIDQFNGCGSNPGPLAVNAGDRIVVQVSSSPFINLTLAAVAFNASLLYTPS